MAVHRRDPSPWQIDIGRDSPRRTAYHWHPLNAAYGRRRFVVSFVCARRYVLQADPSDSLCVALRYQHHAIDLAVSLRASARPSTSKMPVVWRAKSRASLWARNEI